MNIFVIDDNTDLTEMMTKYFTMKGHKCSSTNDGKNALAVLLAQKFDAVLLDLAMPGFSGMDVVNHLSKNDKIKDMNIVALTASSPSQEYEDKLISQGVLTILKKPIDPDILLDFLVRSKK